MFACKPHQNGTTIYCISQYRDNSTTFTGFMAMDFDLNPLSFHSVDNNPANLEKLAIPDPGNSVYFISQFHSFLLEMDLPDFATVTGHNLPSYQDSNEAFCRTFGSDLYIMYWLTSNLFTV